MEAGWQKPVLKAEIDLKAKAAAERGLLLWYKVLREMAELFHLQNNNTLLPLCLTMMRSVEQTLQMNDVMVATWGHKLRVILGEDLEVSVCGRGVYKTLCAPSLSSLLVKLI